MNGGRGGCEVLTCWLNLNLNLNSKVMMKEMESALLGFGRLGCWAFFWVDALPALFCPKIAEFGRRIAVDSERFDVI